MLTGGGVLWAIIVGLAFAAWLKKRARARAKLAQWAREEAALDAAIAAAEASRKQAELEPAEDELPASGPHAPVVEHEGRWYTVH
jgi:hypothetical protein